MPKIDRFNIRVYGLLINESNEILLTEEEKLDYSFTKFPGGGLEFGEGIVDCLIREFKEEANVEVQVVKHFYTTEFFQDSVFRENDQLISVYYVVASKECHNIKSGALTKDATKGEMNRFLWKPLSDLSKEDLTFPIDQHVAKMLLLNV